MSDQSEPLKLAEYHDPLPYVVTLRSRVDEDSPVELQDINVVAYSAYEAMLTAAMEAAASAPPTVKFTVQSIRPDTLAFIQMKLKHAADSLKRLNKR